VQKALDLQVFGATFRHSPQGVRQRAVSALWAQQACFVGDAQPAVASWATPIVDQSPNARMNAPAERRIHVVALRALARGSVPRKNREAASPMPAITGVVPMPNASIVSAPSRIELADSANASAPYKRPQGINAQRAPAPSACVLLRRGMKRLASGCTRYQSGPPADSRSRTKDGRPSM